MPKRTDIKSVMVIGSGPIVIGQAAEFDYSGTQACRVLREEGIRVILVNSNPATIMTDPEMADATYIEPISTPILEQIIAKERPDALLPTLGGQTALNAAMALGEAGVLKKYNVELIGASLEAIDRGEDRELFKKVVEEAGAESARSDIAHSIEEVDKIAEKFGYPLVVRPSFTMGGLGSGIAHDEEELHRIAGAGIHYSPPDEVLIETRCYSNAASDAIYRDFPHAFKCKITYRLSAEGLEQEVMFGNKSDLPMPVGVGFHPPLNVPFAGGDAADYRLRMAVGERFELNGRNLPTGWLLPLDERFARLRAPEGLQATGCEAIEAGFSVREIEAMAVGLRETLDETMISQSPSFIKYLVESLDKLGIPVVTPPGVLGAHVDAMAFCPHIPQTEYPAGALAAAFYLISGIRGMERGTISSVRDENGDEILADVELLRLAVPRRVFTLSQVKYVIDRLAWLYENRDMIGGLKFVYEPPVLRFFMGGLEPTSDWPEKLMIKFRKDFGESL